MSEPVAEKTARALRALRDGRLRALPFTVRFWDGSTLPAATRRAPIVSVRSVEALGYLVREPNQLGLARAWVTGALEVEGDLEAVLAARERYRGVTLSGLERLRLAWSLLHGRGDGAIRWRATGRSCAITTTSQTSSTGWCWDRA